MRMFLSSAFAGPRLGRAGAGDNHSLVALAPILRRLALAAVALWPLPWSYPLTIDTMSEARASPG
ncbi:hypothetical protein AQY21_00545 [Paracoccus sp. MKU1]|nr:hypothetical protein AQY21_00545 [Paracoccus sp. MKU1]